MYFIYKFVFLTHPVSFLHHLQYISLELYKQFCYVLDFNFFVFNICVLYYTVCHTTNITKIIIFSCYWPRKHFPPFISPVWIHFIKLINVIDSQFYQLDERILYFITLIIFLHMFRAILCSSSGGQLYQYTIWYRHSICVTVQYTGYWCSPPVTLYCDAGQQNTKR